MRATSRNKPKEQGKRFTFEGKHTQSEQIVRGEVVAASEEDAHKKLLRRGIKPLRVTRVKKTRQKSITQEDITVFTRQLATMMKAGLPLMQAFEIVARG
ncbi:MAG: type II secretion system F family protein, partial [Neisseria sp.]|nr:type II secretion system F family protein [Neisseria sp.]